MMDSLINFLFKWDRLRDALFAEVHMYDSVKKILDDPTPGSAFWSDLDGWRSWSFDSKNNKYYFNDIPEKTLADAMDHIYLGPEFELDEVW